MSPYGTTTGGGKDELSAHSSKFMYPNRKVAG